MQGLENAVSRLLPNAEHRNCARHIYANWKKKGHSTAILRTLFWKAVKSNSEPEFEQMITQMRVLSEEAVADFRRVGVEKFCRAFILEKTKCESTDNNLSECFNSLILRTRSLPIIDMLEAIQSIVTDRILRKRELFAGSTDDVCPRVRQKLNKNIEKSRKCTVKHAGHEKFEVRTGSRKLVVDLKAKECTCRYWQLRGIPCQHVVACIHWMNKDPASYVNAYLKREKYERSYKYDIPPMNDKDFWPKVEGNQVFPPFVRRQPGRPRRNRRVDNSELDLARPSSSRRGVQMTCSLCHQIGHNRKTCSRRRLQEASKIMINKLFRFSHIRYTIPK